MRDQTVRVELDVPLDLLNAINTNVRDAEPRLLLELIAIELFRENQLSSGKTAEILSVSKRSFIRLLGRRKVPYFTETPEELDRQVLGIRGKLKGGTS